MAPQGCVMRCPSCNAANPEATKFCGNCGQPLRNRCAKCGFENPPQFKFCGECGAALASNPAAPVQTAAARTTSTSGAEHSTDAGEVPDGERKTVTALFADIKGSTELMRDIDPEEARAIVDPALKLMIDSVQRYDGYIVQSTGDGIFALFGAPIAREEHPQRAIYAALRMQEELRRYSGRLREAGNAPIEVRVGINTGEVVVRAIQIGERHTEYTPIGHTTNLAARMQTLAPSGSIAVTEQVRRLAEGYFQFKPLGSARIKGVNEPVSVYEVIGVGPLRTRLQASARRGLSRFAGRSVEMEQMKRALELLKTGNGQIVAAVGEAGVGKSRLFHEFKAVAQSGCTILEAFSMSHGKASAYLPVIELLKGYCGIATEDDARKRREKVIGKVLGLDRSLDDTLPYLFALLGIQPVEDPLAQMDPQIKRRRTLEAVKRIFLTESRAQPLILIFEDLHWIDAETQVLLNLLADSLAHGHILLLVNYRPEYRHEWGSRTYYAQMRLDPLGRESAAEMLTALIGDDRSLDALKQLIIEKTEGNPFFMEETVQVLFDEGSLVRNGTTILTRAPGELKIPPTVRDILASRIDRLPSDERHLLQILAVIGKQFRLRLIRAVAGTSEDILERMVSELRNGEFIYEQPTFPDIEYAFKHALTQEVAYDSILLERRKLLHQNIASAIEAQFFDQIDDHLGELARHYRLSGNADEAIKYLRLAGEQLNQRSAHNEAAAHLNSALELLVHLPAGIESTRLEIELRLALSKSVATSKGYAAPELDELNHRTLELSKALGDPELHFRALMFDWAFHQVRRDLNRAAETSRELMVLSGNLHDPRMIVHANYAAGAVSLFRGEVVHAIQRFEESRRIYRPGGLGEEPHDPGVTSLAFLASALWISGYPAQALRASDEALKLARQLGHSLSLVIALAYRAMLHLCRREPDRALESAEEACRTASDRGFQYWASLAAAYRGIALAASGRVEEGIAETLKAIDAYRATGSELGAALIMVGVASSYLHAGRTEEALAAATRGLATNEQTGARLSEAELYRLKGKSLLSSDLVEAQSCFHKAIELAREQEARAWELRASMDFSRLLHNQGMGDQARTILSQIYDWFTEGFDTADLRDAKELLDELKGPA